MKLFTGKLGMKALLVKVKKGYDDLKLVISHEKSQIVSPDDIVWNLVDIRFIPVVSSEIIYWKIRFPRNFKFSPTLGLAPTPH